LFLSHVLQHLFIYVYDWNLCDRLVQIFLHVHVESFDFLGVEIPVVRNIAMAKRSASNLGQFVLRIACSGSRLLLLKVWDFLTILKLYDLRIADKAFVCRDLDWS